MDTQPNSTNPLQNYRPTLTEIEQGLADTMFTGTDFFNVKTGRVWMEESHLKPVPNKLFGELWNEGEVCILFADTNVGNTQRQIAEMLGVSLGCVSKHLHKE